MKRIALLLTAGMLLALCACGQEAPAAPETTAEITEIITVQPLATEEAAVTSTDAPVSTAAAQAATERLTQEEWEETLDKQMKILRIEGVLLQKDMALEEEKLALIEQIKKIADTDPAKAQRMTAEVEALDRQPRYMDASMQKNIKLLQAEMDKDAQLKGIEMTQGLLDAVFLATAEPAMAKPLITAYLRSGRSAKSAAFANALYFIAETVERMDG